MAVKKRLLRIGIAAMFAIARMANSRNISSAGK